MDKIRQQKLKEFILKIDASIRDMRNYLMLEKGGFLLDEIKKFEEANGEFLQYYPEGQEALNQRKYIIDFLLFPIISDEKVSELLQYHLTKAIDAGLDVDELMRQRAISASELIWPKLSQEYLKAITQNTELIGASPIQINGDKNSYLPYVKNWINAYNQKFGIEKHSGLEPHQFALEDPNARRLVKSQKELLLKILKFYESLKVYSLSEIEKEVRKINEMIQPTVQSLNKQKGVTQLDNERKNEKAGFQKNSVGVAPSSSNKIPVINQNKNLAREETEEVGEGRIKIMGELRQNQSSLPAIKKSDPSTPTESPVPTTKGHILDLINRFSNLGEDRITGSSIKLVGAPFSASPSLKNWIDFYFKECGKGSHKPQERESFIERIKISQNLNPEEIKNLEIIFRSLDEKTLLPYDEKTGKIAFGQISIGKKLSTV